MFYKNTTKIDAHGEIELSKSTNVSTEVLFTHRTRLTIWYSQPNTLNIKQIANTGDTYKSDKYIANDVINVSWPYTAVAK